MSFFIYLDQNSLSDLRQRKIEETGDEQFKLLRLVLESEQVHLVYSHVTLEEIFQIPKREYKNEHIELLVQLNAIYIEPLTLKLNEKSPEDIWSEFLENKQSNIDMGIDSLISISQLFWRKMSGLPVEKSFTEIHDQLKNSLNDLLTNCEVQLSSIDQSSLSEAEKKSFIKIKHPISDLRKKASTLRPFEINNGQQLGPQPFREIPEIKSMDIKNMDATLVVREIEHIFKLENSSFNLEEYFERTPQTDVARAYSLMNWAGYYADDFTRVKKVKDRFNASNNDMQHAVAALGASFLVSNDVNFRKKAEACFAYVSCPTIVCSPKEFVEQHCVFV